MTSTKPNLSIPDELANVRNEMAALKKREAELRQIALDDPSARLGAAFNIAIRTFERMQVDGDLLRTKYPKIHKEVCRAIKVQTVRLVDNEGSGDE